MRTTLQRSIRATTMAGVFFMAACSKYNNDNPTAPVVVSSTVPSALTSGTWTIASLMQGTEDKSSQFSGFVFVFSGSGGESGTVTATKGGTSVTGTWSHNAAVTYYGGTSSIESIVLSFGTVTPFDRLTGTWNVMANTSSSLTLANPEVAEGEHLVFAKQ